MDDRQTDNQETPKKQAVPEGGDARSSAGEAGRTSAVHELRDAAEAADAHADRPFGRKGVGRDATPMAKRAGNSGAQPGVEKESAARTGSGKTTAFLVAGILLLLVAANAGFGSLAQLPNGQSLLAGVLAFSALLVVCTVHLIGWYRRERTGTGDTVQRMVREAYRRGVVDGQHQAKTAPSTVRHDEQECPATREDGQTLIERMQVAAAKKAASERESRQRAAASDPAERLLARTQDTLGTLRSLVENPQAAEEYQGLRQLLLGVGLPQWDTAPKASCRLLERNRCFWIAADTNGLKPADYDRLMAVEAALNLFRAVHSADPAMPAASYIAAARQRLQAVYQLKETDADVFRWLSLAYPDPADQEAGSEWGQRIAIADAAEDAPLPFRLDFTMRANVQAGVVLIRLEVPRPASFACVAAGDDERKALAVSYALRSALFMVQAAFRVPAAQRVVVSCHEHDSLRTVLSLQTDRDAAERLQQRAAHAGGWFDDQAIRVRFTNDGWFGAVEPHLRQTDEVLLPDLYELPAELDQRACDEGLVRISGAKTVADFGINEDAERQQVWRLFTDDQPTTVGEAVSRLLDLKGAATRQTTRDACDQAVRALAEGTVDLSDKAGMRELLLAHSDLQEAVSYARKVITGDDPDAVNRAIDRLKAALSTGLEIAYLDDTDTVFRYFGSVAERVAFNRRFASDGRKVRLVPDAYFNALELAARLLTLMGRNDEAMPYADEAIRIAPESIDAVLIKARVLENRSDVFAAADLVRQVLSHATSNHDLALCLYRLAYFEWKLGRGKLSVACYKAVIALHTTISGQATLELAQVIAADSAVGDMAESQVHAQLNAAGIPYRLSPVTEEWLTECAIRCTDAHFFSTAASLTGSLVEVLRDDALVDMYKSLHG